MSEVTAVPEAISAFGDLEAIIAADLIAAGTVNVAAVSALLTPVFGVIGAEHLAATVAAMATNAFETAQLAAVHAGHAAAAHSIARNFSTVDEDNSVQLSNIGTLI